GGPPDAPSGPGLGEPRLHPAPPAAAQGTGAEPSRSASGGDPRRVDSRGGAARGRVGAVQGPGGRTAGDTRGLTSEAGRASPPGRAAAARRLQRRVGRGRNGLRDLSLREGTRRLHAPFAARARRARLVLVRCCVSRLVVLLAGSSAFAASDGDAPAP